MNQAVESSIRLKGCGLVFHERVSDNKRWVGPPERRLDGEPVVKVTTLDRVTPKPNMEIRAHGEIYLLPPDFSGSWFDIASDTGKPMIQ